MLELPARFEMLPSRERNLPPDPTRRTGDERRDVAAAHPRLHRDASLEIFATDVCRPCLLLESADSRWRDGLSQKTLSDGPRTSVLYLNWSATHCAATMSAAPSGGHAQAPPEATVFIAAGHQAPATGRRRCCRRGAGPARTRAQRFQARRA